MEPFLAISCHRICRVRLAIDPANQLGVAAWAGGAGANEMETSLKTAVDSYLRAKTVSRGTCNEYASTIRKWDQWGRGAPIEALQRKDVREFLD